MIRMFNKQYGYFLPAFLYINIDEDIDFNNFKGCPDEVKGTFIHEYCHYLQDVSTTFGYMNFLNGFQDFLSKIYIKDEDSETEQILYHNNCFNCMHHGDSDIEGYRGNIVLSLSFVKKATEKSDRKTITKKSEIQIQSILEYMDDERWYKANELTEILGLKDTRTKELLRKMVAMNLLEDNGATKGKTYRKKLTLWNKLWEINTLSKFIQDYSRFIQDFDVCG